MRKSTIPAAATIGPTGFISHRGRVIGHASYSDSEMTLRVVRYGRGNKIVAYNEEVPERFLAVVKTIEPNVL